MIQMRCWKYINRSIRGNAAKWSTSCQVSDRNTLFVKFHGTWGLYLRSEKKTLNVNSLDIWPAQVEDEFGPALRQKPMEQSFRLEGGIVEHSFILLNDRGVLQLKDDGVRVMRRCLKRPWPFKRHA